MSYGDLIDIDILREGLKELCIKMNKEFSTQREIKDEDTFKPNSSLVIPEVFNFFLSGSQFKGKVTPYVLYYNQAAVSLGDLNGKNGAGYTMNISTSHTEGEASAITTEKDNNQPVNIRTGHRVPLDGEILIFE